MQKDDNNTISGLSLTSFLQLLEQEEKTCTLLVANEVQKGKLFLAEGRLIDAETDDEVGVEAAYSILSWDNPTFKISGARERGQRIDQSLAYILMNAAKKQDENSDDKASQNPSVAYRTQGNDNPLLEAMMQALKKIPGIRHYFILSRQGKMVAYSEQNKKMGDFIAYCVVEAGQIRKILDIKGGPKRILVTLKNGQMVLIFSSGGMIFALLIHENVSADDIFEKLRRSFAEQAGR